MITPWEEEKSGQVSQMFKARKRVPENPCTLNFSPAEGSLRDHVIQALRFTGKGTEVQRGDVISGDLRVAESWAQEYCLLPKFFISSVY